MSMMPRQNVLDCLHLSIHKVLQKRDDAWSQLRLLTERLAHAPDVSAASLAGEVEGLLGLLEPIERHCGFLGQEAFALLRQRFERRQFSLLSRDVSKVVDLMASPERYAGLDIGKILASEPAGNPASPSAAQPRNGAEQLRFAVLFVEDDLTPHREQELRAKLEQATSSKDKFAYTIIHVSTLEDALAALMLNQHIQCCILGQDFPLRSASRLPMLEGYLAELEELEAALGAARPRGLVLGAILCKLRPELDLYLFTDATLFDMGSEVHRHFRRVFYSQEDYREVHLSILQGVQQRYETPFFDALKNYSQQPTGVFHAMPLARGNSIFKSAWIRDMGEFYGQNIFLAETSATSGGLDSLLHPTGSLKKAQDLAAKAFGAEQTFFVTNGTSTANKIVVQAILSPGDIVLIDQYCHKSHHYGIVLTGAHPLYLEPYALTAYSIYGAVPLKEIKRQLLKLKREGALDRVKMLALTNCTFDGIVYNVRRVMEEVLAIKPDMVFLWDEAWYAFARLTSIYRERTAMQAAAELRARYSSDEYRKEYAAFRQKLGDLDPDDERTWLEERLLPDPDEVKIRVYATQSTHKSLSALRQSAMIHIWDEEFSRRSEVDFIEAYMTHTSTSPNYQILASLDVARRQIDLEGFRLMQSQLETAMAVRERVNEHPLLRKWFRMLDPEDLIPEAYRPSGLRAYGAHGDPAAHLRKIEDAWRDDEFVLDPTRLTMYIGKTGIRGHTFRDAILMDRHSVQINKTSLNTALLMTNVGTTWGAVAYLLECLLKIAEGVERELRGYNPVEMQLFASKVRSLTAELPVLPGFSKFHESFRLRRRTGAGDLRTAYFLGLQEPKVEYLDLAEVERAMASGREIVASMFIIPTPPACPILVPGQVVSKEIIALMRALDPGEIHGYRPEFGLPVFTQEALDGLQAADPDSSKSSTIVTGGSNMLKKSAFTHLAIAVTNLDASIAFYAKYGQMSVVRTRAEPGTIWLSDRIRPFALALLEEKEVKPIEPPTHIGIACENRKEVDHLCELARKEGRLIEEPADYGPPTGYAAYLRDPDGHHVEISYDQEAAYEPRYTPYTDLA